MHWEDWKLFPTFQSSQPEVHSSTGDFNDASAEAGRLHTVEVDPLVELEWMRSRTATLSRSKVSIARALMLQSSLKVHERSACSWCVLATSSARVKCNLMRRTSLGFARGVSLVPTLGQPTTEGGHRAGAPIVHSRLTASVVSLS
eukprot:768303-Amphidinium_carterae.1